MFEGYGHNYIYKMLVYIDFLILRKANSFIIAVYSQKIIETLIWIFKTLKLTLFFSLKPDLQKLLQTGFEK